MKEEIGSIGIEEVKAEFADMVFPVKHIRKQSSINSWSMKEDCFEREEREAIEACTLGEQSLHHGRPV